MGVAATLPELSECTIKIFLWQHWNVSSLKVVFQVFPPYFSIFYEWIWILCTRACGMWIL